LCIGAAAQTQWEAPRLFKPLLGIGRHSYEIYMTHMFIVFACFGVFLEAGKSMRLVPALFIAVILVSAVLGALVSRFFSEPLNNRLRRRWLADSRMLAPNPETETIVPGGKSIVVTG
jgi:peptidoglycan/LPS O-acetylase OafA/YrhL